jgi:hypothetical protein
VITDPDDAALTISKTVAGTQGNTTHYFAFTVAPTQPSTVTGTEVYKGYVVENVLGSDTVVTSSQNSAAVVTDPGDDYINFPADGTATAVNLKHGQRLVFVDAHIGAKYVAVETDAFGHTANINLTTNSVGPTNLGNVTTTGTQPVTEGTDIAAFVNTLNATAPTGINLNTIPFIGLIALAALALAAYVIVRSRRRKNENGSY